MTTVTMNSSRGVCDGVCGNIHKGPCVCLGMWGVCLRVGSLCELQMWVSEIIPGRGYKSMSM